MKTVKRKKRRIANDAATVQQVRVLKRYNISLKKADDKPSTNKTTMKDAPGMKGNRSRNENGLLRDKRDDTHMGTVERQYGRNFDVRSDMHLGTYLQQKGVKSLNDLINGG